MSEIELLFLLFLLCQCSGWCQVLVLGNLVEELDFVDGYLILWCLQVNVGVQIDFVVWICIYCVQLCECLLWYGVLLYCNMGIDDVVVFKGVVDVLGGGEWLIYENCLMLCMQLDDCIYIFIEYFVEYVILLYNENLYMYVWLGVIYFYVQQLSVEGGEMLIVDSRKVYVLFDLVFCECFEW